VINSGHFPTDFFITVSCRHNQTFLTPFWFVLLTESEIEVGFGWVREGLGGFLKYLLIGSAKNPPSDECLVFAA